jgi:Y_Y_Y domain/Histidine kinase-, DNA gyrase B-, and HSP90-like ATPase/Histidine kinase
MKKNTSYLSFLLFLCLQYSHYIVGQDIHFQEFTLNGVPFSNAQLKQNNLSFNESNDLKIRIVHLDSDTLLYQYYFDGIDKKWTDYQKNINLFFHQLPGGKYVFMIRQKNNPTIQKSITLNLHPQLWQLWWFLPSIYLFISIIIGSAFYFIFLYRLRQAVQMRQVRNHIAADLHDEIGATLSGIGILSALAQKNLDKSHPSFGLLGRINDDALSIGNTMDDIVWSINPKNDDLENIIARMSRYAAELFDAKEIDYQIVIPENLKEVKLSMEQRRDVYLIFKEAVNNLVKYSKCKNALVEIKVSKQFELLIRDDGRGFDPMMETPRNGLKNMKNRAKDLNGNLEIKSEIGIGTAIKLVFMI